MEQYRPFLFIDLDTIIVQSLEKIFDLVKNQSLCIFLEDFWVKRHLATGLLWIPAMSDKIKRVWRIWSEHRTGHSREDRFLTAAILPDIFWQKLTDTIIDFKPKENCLLSKIPPNANLICFHGKPRIFETDMPWVLDYIKEYEDCSISVK
jgi:hypothetical protein